MNYNTKQKQLILNCLMQNKDRHITADEIKEFLSKGNDMVGKTTIYRYLDKLVSQGLVRKYTVEGGKSACYQYMDQMDQCRNHFHLKCVDCGQLIHLECDYLDDINKHIQSHHDFKIDHSKTVLYGQCGKCAKKN
jgi:Fe2+/Zn2+ uptake regulation proteins